QRAAPVRRRRNSWPVPVLLVVVLVALGIFGTPRTIDNGSPLPTMNRYRDVGETPAQGSRPRRYLKNEQIVRFSA
ncbi:MAG: hypothetical protein ACE1ZA_14320, partial [Pseudomonadales bacterium]